MEKNDIVILGYARTPVGDFLGSLKDVPLLELTKTAGQAALERAGVKPELVEELALGCIYKHGNKGNPARQVEIALGIPESAWAYTVDQQCASGMKAVDLVMRSLLTGGCKLGLAIGAESMSRAPYLSMSMREGQRIGDGKMVDVITHEGLICAMENYHMGLTAENLAEQYNISREEQDELAVLSHSRASAAVEAGRFDEEIVPVEIQTRKGAMIVDKDEHPRADASMEGMAKLQPAFKKEGGTVTAGNASGINDGAAALTLATAGYAEKFDLKPVARILSSVSFGVEPRIMGIGPAFAVPKALAEAGLSEDQIDYYEINEAFAAQFLAVNRELKLDMDKVNSNGSGVGIGHPVGMTGARILMATITELKARKGKYGVASLCVGGGPAMAMVIELL